MTLAIRRRRNGTKLIHLFIHLDQTSSRLIYGI
jgi:hypothetical protein